ncbi:MAG: NAD-dependent epimerase/dehydratase family protein [Brevibacterium sp.]
MKVLLAGASGAIGIELVPKLQAAGHSVLGLSHSTTGAERVRALGAEAVVADLLHAESVARALVGHSADAVIHQATGLDRTPTRHRDLRHTNALRTVGTQNLLTAARQIGARRFVTQSFFLGYGYRDHGGASVDETQPFAVSTGTRFDEHLHAMQSNEDQVLGAPDIEGITLRYGLFYGNDRSTRQMRRQLLARRLPVIAPSAVTSFIHLEDAASCTVAALEHGRQGHSYNVADDHPLALTEFIRTLADVSGAPQPWAMPGWALRPLPYAHAFMVKSSIRMSAAKAKDELGWQPRYPSSRDGLEALRRHWNDE